MYMGDAVLQFLSGLEARVCVLSRVVLSEF